MSISTHTATDLIADIRRKTAIANRNNVTRTASYLQFYLQHPEIEWALLAHLVSRNSGWNMTDLHGEWLPHIMSEKQRIHFFMFLERCNWLIFHDAYAQLLLYAEMKQSSSDLTSLLPKLGVSTFMVPIWQQFLQNGDKKRLTWALIVNEQQYIQQRVVFQTFFQQQVLNSFLFQAQSVLSLNHVLFPYRAQPDDPIPRLVGIDVHRFPDVERRILTGKTLYHLITVDKSRYKKMIQWATEVSHTGSRADYWPHLFHFSPTADRQSKYQKRFNKGKLLPHQPKLYSPKLTAVWPDTEQPAADGTDWYQGEEKWLDFLQPDELLPTITEEEYREGLQLVDTGISLLEIFP